MKGLTYNLDKMIAISHEDYQELLGFKKYYEDILKRGFLRGTEFTTMQQEREIVRRLKKEFIDCDEYPPLTKWYKELVKTKPEEVSEQ